MGFVTKFDVNLYDSVHVYLGKECGYVDMWVKSQRFFFINTNESFYAYVGEECGCNSGLIHKV